MMTLTHQKVSAHIRKVMKRINAAWGGANDITLFFYLKMSFSNKRLQNQINLGCVIRLKGAHNAQCLPLDNSDPIEIQGRKNCGPTLDGEEVIVKILGSLETKVSDTKQAGTKKTGKTDIQEESVWVPRGRVVYITKKANRKSMKFLCASDAHSSRLMRPLCGTVPKIRIVRDGIESRHRNTHQFVPLHKMRNSKPQLKKDVKLDAKSMDNQLFQVCYLKWEPSCMYPLGYAKKHYPVRNDVEHSQKMLDLMYQVNRKKHKHVQDLQIELGNGIPPQWFEGRKDLSDETTVSIDPTGCRHVDDAFSIKEIRDGDGQKQYEVGVHIADASRFLSKDSELDTEVQSRLFTFNSAVQGQNRPMLPPLISEQFCSLQENEKRLALSAIFLFSSGGSILKKPVIQESIIRNKAQLSYHQAQEIITKDTGISGTSAEIAKAVLNLYRISRNLRKSRMQGSSLYRKCHRKEPGIIADLDAQELVEEFMLLTNETVAKYLMEDNPEIVPLRKQLPPQPKLIDQWESINSDILPLSLYFQRYSGSVLSQKQLTHESQVFLLQPVYKELRQLLNARCGLSRKVASLVGQESLHPQHWLAISDWYSIQNSAIVECARKENNEHFELQKDLYTRFTSPMRRYEDIIVYRLVKAKIHKEPAPYAKDEAEDLCNQITKAQMHYKKYHKACKQLECVAKFQKSPIYMQGVIAKITNEGMHFIFPYMANSHSQKTTFLKYNELSVDRKPEMEEALALKPKCCLVWKKRIYEGTGSHPSARTKESAKEEAPLMLDPHQHAVRLSGIAWKKLQDVLSNVDMDGEQAVLDHLLEELQNTLDSEKPSEGMASEVTSEMKESPLFKHHVCFGLDVMVGGVLQIQVAATCIQGVLQPEPCLLNITPTFDICVLHKRHPIRCFADIATKPVKTRYRDVDEYKGTWQPILAMESAYRAVRDSNPIIVNKVWTKLDRSNNRITGELVMLQSFCKERSIRLVRKDQDREEGTKEQQCLFHYICLRHDTDDRMPQDGAQPGGFAHSTFKNLWMGHATVVEAMIEEDENKMDNEAMIEEDEKKKNLKVRVKFTVNQRDQCCVDPPESLYQRRQMCTVELLGKPLPHE